MLRSRMTETEIVKIVIQALAIIAGAAPGLLAAITSTSSDEEALERAARALASAPTDPALRGIERYRARLSGLA